MEALHPLNRPSAHPTSPTTPNEELPRLLQLRRPSEKERPWFLRARAPESPLVPWQHEDFEPSTAFDVLWYRFETFYKSERDIPICLRLRWLLGLRAAYKPLTIAREDTLEKEVESNMDQEMEKNQRIANDVRDAYMKFAVTFAMYPKEKYSCFPNPEDALLDFHDLYKYRDELDELKRLEHAWHRKQYRSYCQWRATRACGSRWIG